MKTHNAGPYRTSISLEQEEPMNDVDKLALKVLEADPSILIWDRDWNMIKLDENAFCGIKITHRKKQFSSAYECVSGFYLYYQAHDGNCYFSVRPGLNVKIGKQIQKLACELAEKQIGDAMFRFEEKLRVYATK